MVVPAAKGCGTAAQMDRSEQPLIRRASAWNWLVAASAGVLLVLGAGVGLWWAISSEERVSTYGVRGALEGIRLDLGDADVEIVGRGDQPNVRVRRTDRFAFGHPSEAQRAVSAGVLSLRSRCPRTVLGSCKASYRLEVPDNVPVRVRTGSGNVRFREYRGSARVDTGGGDVAIEGWCGFTMIVNAASGNVRAGASCQPERIELRTTSGSVQAQVPPGRYRIDADSDSGSESIRGVTAADDAPFRIQALSRSGDVAVDGGA